MFTTIITNVILEYDSIPLQGKTNIHWQSLPTLPFSSQPWHNIF
jgi:hypothetical protein